MLIKAEGSGWCNNSLKLHCTMFGMIVVFLAMATVKNLISSHTILARTIGTIR